MQKEQPVVEDRKEAVKDKLKKDMADLQNDVVNIDERIKQIEAKIKNPKKLRMTIEKFSNLLNSLINRLEKRRSRRKGHFDQKYGFEPRNWCTKKGDLQI